MTWSQTLVVSWAQFVLAAALLLAAARAVMRWIVQPAERIRLIQLALTAAIGVPLLMALAPWPAWRVGLISAAGRIDANSVERARHEPEAISMPPVNLPIPPDMNGSLPAPPERPAPRIPLDVHSVPAALSLASPQTPSAVARPAALDGWLIAAIVLALVHGIAAAFFVAEWVIGTARLRRLVLSAADASPAAGEMWDAISLGSGRRVRLLVSTEITTPLTFGWWRPVVVIPLSVATGGGQSLRYCLAHEWSHIERADILAFHGLWLCQFALWYQPLFWTLRRELRICQDVLADGAATSGGRDAVEYSELLVDFARKHLAAPLTGALTFLDHPSQLMRRVSMLLQRPIALRAQCTWTFSLTAGLTVALACGLCTAVRIDAASPADEEPAKESKPSPQPSGEKAEKPAETGGAPPKASPEAVPPYEQPAHLTYHCIVVDRETGQRVPNARVTVERSDSSTNHWPFKTIEKTTHVTDAQGQYTIEIPPEQSGNRSLYIQIYAEHDDYVRYFGGYSLSMIRKNETVGERPFFERLKLRPADRITGKVVSPLGEPLAAVKLFGFTTMKTRDLNNNGWLDAKTEADGSFRLNMMKGGVAFFWVMPNDYSVVQRFASHGPVDLGEIRVPEGIRLSGRAISVEGKPVAGIAVNAYYQGKESEPLQPYAVLSGIRRGAITDADGRFTLDPLPPGEYRVVPEDELGDPRHERDLHPLRAVFVAQQTTLTEGAAPVDLELQAVPHVNFHAQYLDSQGKKRKGSEFFISGRLDSQFWSAKARPDQDGAVSVRLPHGLQNVQLGIPTNEHSALRHRKGRGKPVENHQYNVRLGTLNDDVEGFEIIRYKAPLVVVQAMDEAGQPIKDFQVVADYAWKRNPMDRINTQVSIERQEDGRRRTEQLLPDEEVTFTVTATGYESATETLKLPEGETNELVLTLKKAAESKQE